MHASPTGAQLHCHTPCHRKGWEGAASFIVSVCGRLHLQDEVAQLLVVEEKLPRPARWLNHASRRRWLWDFHVVTEKVLRCAAGEEGGEGRGGGGREGGREGGSN